MRTTSRFCLILALASGPLLFGSARLARAEEKKPTRGLRYPTLVPDGKTVVFAWRGDIWRAPVEGGSATRLTIHEAQDTKPRVSPDGKWIAFSSRRTGNYDVFVMPIDGGEPRQVTFHSGNDFATDWSADGKKILFYSGRDPQPYGTDLYEIDVAGGTPRRLTRDGGRDGSYSPDGKSVAYIRGFNTVYQDAYEGSASYDVYVTDLEGGTPRRLTKTPGNELNPCWSSDGQTIWFLADEKGAMNFRAIPAAGGETKTLTAWKDDDTRRATLAWDRKTVAFERDGRLNTLDLTTVDAKAKPIELTVESDVRNGGADVHTITSGAEHSALSPDGSRLAVAVRGDLWLLSSGGGDAVRLSTSSANEDWPRWSPDGRRLAYFSDASGTNDVYVMDLATHDAKIVAGGPDDQAFPAWAADGKHLVYTSNHARNKDLYLLDLETGEDRQLTKDPKDDDDATVSSDGKWIAFDSGRGGSQAIYVMPFSGGEAQARRVSGGNGFFQVPSFSPDASMLAYEEMDPASGSSGGVWAVKATGGPAIQISRDGQGACWSPRGDWIYFTAERVGVKDLYRVRAPQTIEAGEKVSFLGRVEVERRLEFGNLFDEAWQKLKDGFYDEHMHGVDWSSLKSKYRPLAVDCEIKDEFYSVVSQMLGELRASHLGIFPGQDEDEGAGRDVPQTGYLGLELDGTPPSGGGRKVTSVQAKGPADEAGLRVGDVVKSINGTTLKAGSDLDRVLAGAAGKEVALVFSKGDGSGEKTLSLKAVAGGALSSLKYQLWVEKAKKTVEERTKGEAGYIHLNQMDQPNLARFSAALSELNQKKVKGLVLDVRNNGGGNIHPQLIDALSNRPFIQFQPRGAGKQTQPALYWGKPVVLLINERSFSDAEVFPYSFKQMGLGKVVGVPTAGGVIGTNDITLSDGSKFRIPRVGWYGLNGENLEHLGVPPDILVEETVDDRLKGLDPQLDRALEVILSEIRPAGGAPTPAAPEKKPEAPAPESPKPDPARPEASGGHGGGSGTTESASAGTALENPLYDAKVGEWVKMRVKIAGGERVIVTRVAEVTDGDVGLESALDGAPAGAAAQPMRMPRTKDFAPKGGSADVEGKEVVTVNGVELHCTVAVIHNPDGSTEKRWMSNEVPVRGTVRVERDGQVVSELLEWGTK